MDVVEVGRLERAVSRHGEDLLGEILEPWEIDRSRRSPHFLSACAAAFAAKEALFKALGTGWTGGVTWLDGEVGRQPSGAPVLRLHGEAARKAEALGASRAHISLSHSESMAVAVVVLET